MESLIPCLLLGRPAIASALGIKLEGLFEEMRKPMSEIIDQTTDEPETVAILEALEKEYRRRPAVEVSHRR